MKPTVADCYASEAKDLVVVKFTGWICHLSQTGIKILDESRRTPALPSILGCDITKNSRKAMR